MLFLIVKMVMLYVCNVCGEPYLGGEAPDDCPFCGAPKSYMKSMDEFSEIWKGDLSEGEKSDMKETVDLEVNAAAYYLDVAGVNEKYGEANRLFKQLARVEKEHAEVAVKFLGIDLPEFVGEKSKGSVDADLARVKELESDAIAKYEGFLKNAVSDNVKNFYVALIHAEKGHLDIVS